MKKVKMMLYGDPGVGKSVFALGFPKPFFITTDGNYEWLEEFGAKEKDHVQVGNWQEAKKAFNSDFEGYETVVVDLTEDLFKWCEYDFCEQKKIDHVGDLGFGKGYDITRNEFFIEICKLISKPKHILFLSHEEIKIIKDRRGVDHTTHRPSTKIPDKVMDSIEGRLRYVVRCYLKADESEDGTLTKKRYLSLIPKENEYGIVRGIDENQVSHDIPLNAKIFLQTIGVDDTAEKVVEKPRVVEVRKPEKPAVEKPVVKEEVKIEEAVVEKPIEVEKPAELAPKKEKLNLDEIKAKLAKLKAEKQN